MMMDYKLLEALLAVEREGSFERAAKAIGVTSSAVSQRIKTLEERYGGIMIHRGMPTKISKLGASFCRHAEKVQLLEHDFVGLSERDYLSNSKGPISLHIAVNDDSLSSWFEEVLSSELSFDEKYLLSITIADQDFSQDTMLQHHVLAAVCSEKEPIQGYKSFYLGDHIYRATASQTFMDRYFPVEVTRDALMRAPALRYSPKDDLQLQWLESVFGESFLLPSHMLPSSYGFVNACRNSVAWGMNPALMVDDHIQSGELVELIEGAVLAKPLYWHVSRAILESISDLTDRVVTAARRQLVQSLEANTKAALYR